MDCPICSENYPVSTGRLCTLCTYRFCDECYGRMTASGRTLTCPQCRQKDSLIKLGVKPAAPEPSFQPQRQPVSMLQICRGTYAGGRRACTYTAQYQLHGPPNSSYCERCLKIRLGYDRRMPIESILQDHGSGSDRSDDEPRVTRL